MLNIEVPGRKPQGNPKKTWINNEEEDLAGWKLDQEDVFDREKWGALIKRQKGGSSSSQSFSFSKLQCLLKVPPAYKHEDSLHHFEELVRTCFSHITLTNVRLGHLMAICGTRHLYQLNSMGFA